MAKTWAEIQFKNKNFCFISQLVQNPGNLHVPKYMHMLVDTYNRVKIRTNEGEIPFI